MMRMLIVQLLCLISSGVTDLSIDNNTALVKMRNINSRLFQNTIAGSEAIRSDLLTNPVLRLLSAAERSAMAADRLLIV